MMTPRRDPFLPELERRIGEWGRSEWRRELAQGFPLLRSVKSRTTRWLVRTASTMAPSERELVCEALVKRYWGDASGSRDLGEHEARVLNAVLDEAGRFETGGPRLARPPPDPKVNRRAFARALREALVPAAGAYDRERTDSYVVQAFTRVVKGCTIATFVDIGGVRGLSYAHALFPPGGGDVHVSLMSWLGVTSDTHWDKLGDEDVPGAVDALANLCRHFFAKLPELLEGIDEAPPPVT